MLVKTNRYMKMHGETIKTIVSSIKFYENLSNASRIDRYEHTDRRTWHEEANRRFLRLWKSA